MNDEDKELSNVDWLRKYGFIDEDKEKLKAEYLANAPEIETEEETERKIKQQQTAQKIANFSSLIGALANVVNVGEGAVSQQIVPQTKDIDYNAIREKYRNARNTIGLYKNKANEYVQGILDKRADAAKAAAGIAQGQARLAEAQRHNQWQEQFNANKALADLNYKNQQLALQQEKFDESKDYHDKSIAARNYATSVSHKRIADATTKTTPLYVPSNGTTYNIPQQSYKAALEQLAGIAGVPLTKRVKTKDAVSDNLGNTSPAEYRSQPRSDKEILKDIIKQIPTNPDLVDALEHLSTGKSVDADAAAEYGKRHASDVYTKAAKRKVYPLVISTTGKTEYFDTPEAREERKKQRAKEVEKEERKKTNKKNNSNKGSATKAVFDTFN